VPHYDDEGEAGFGRAPERLGYERRARAVKLVLRKDGHRRERQHLGTQPQPGTAERYLTDHRAVADRDQAKLRNVGLRFA
jgi:hypothetical protein